MGRVGLYPLTIYPCSDFKFKVTFEFKLDEKVGGLMFVCNKLVGFVELWRNLCDGDDRKGCRGARFFSL